MTKDANQPTAEEARVSQALGMVKNYAYGGAAAILVPIPIFDIVSVLAVQLVMARRLADLYEVEYFENLARALIVSLVGLGTSLFTYPMLKSLLKIVPVVSLVSGAVSGSVLGGASTYAVGRVLIQHFDSGGTFLTLDPEKVRAFYQEALETGEQELRLTRPPRP